MRSEHLKYFLSLAETHSLSKTSVEFYTTHQNVSKVIRQLEKEMNVPLFHRTPHGMVLTPEGELLLPAAREAIRLFREVHLAIDHMERRHDMDGQLTIWGTPAAIATCLQPLINDFCSLYPKVRYQIHDAPLQGVLEYVARHHDALGLIIVMHDNRYQDALHPLIDQVQTLPLFRDEYFCLVSNRSPLARSREISFRDFAQHPIALFLSDPDDEAEHPLAQMLEKLCHTAPALTTQNRQLYVQSIVSGHFIGIATRRSHELLTAFSGEAITLVPFCEDLSLDIALITHPDPALDDVAQAFIDMLHEQNDATL